ncbi:MAG: ribosome maturation factor RimP [Cyclobacteriaceae bacterium]|jgi:ribosome maturation factor RimP
MVDQQKLESEIQSQVEGLISEDPSLFIVDVALKGSSGNQRLMIYLDGDQGVSIAACASVSRRLSGFLEENDLIEGKYYLEVTSAGLDQPLRFLRQYKKNIGRSLSIKMLDGQLVEGELKTVNDTGITLLRVQKKTEETFEIGFDEIDSSKVLVSFK